MGIIGNKGRKFLRINSKQGLILARGGLEEIALTSGNLEGEISTLSNLKEKALTSSSPD